MIQSIRVSSVQHGHGLLDNVEEVWFCSGFCLYLDNMSEC